MNDRKPALITIVTAVAAIIAVGFITMWLDRIFWEHGPRLLGVSVASLGCAVLVAWLVWQAWEKFWKRGNDSTGALNLRPMHRNSDSRPNLK